jgi:hypothetical protein
LARVHLPDTVRHLSVRAPYIYASTEEKSLSVYKVEEQDGTFTIQKFFGDQYNRPTISHAIVDLPPGFQRHGELEQRLILLTDLNSRLTVLEQPSSKGFVNAVAPVLETKLPRMLSRIDGTAFRPPWRQNSTSRMFPDILGTSPSGALVHMRILPEVPAKLVAFICRLSDYTKQAEESRKKTWMNPMPICVNPDRPRYYRPENEFGSNQEFDLELSHNLVSDGDKIMPLLLAEHAETELMKMIIQPAWETALHDLKYKPETVGNDENGRRIIFVDLVKRAREYIQVGEAKEDVMELEMGLEEAVEWCVEWMRELLDDVL